MPHDSNQATDRPGMRPPGLLDRKLNLTPLLGQMVMILFFCSAASVATNYLRERPVTWFPDGKPVSKTPSNIKAGPDGTIDRPEPPVADQGGLTADAVFKHLSAGTATFVDAREPHEYEESHLRGSIHLPSSSVYANIDAVMSLPPEGLVIVYCTGGQCEASHTVQRAMEEYGFTNVQIYEKGWEEISSSGRFGEYIEQGAGQ